ncbi:MAG: sigma 54-interacting transcriptional regulator, partial [Thermodesulfobacteriota bacterium]
AYGIKADLERCLQLIEKNGKIEFFRPGENDFSDRFQIAEKLYGRESEIITLLDAFDRVTTGAREIILVSGYSGIGKSAIVNEIHKPVVRQHGYFVSGKFDQFKRNTPYSAIFHAFQELIKQILTESEKEVETWKDKILNALGTNGQVVIDVIPEVELIIGNQPSLPELPRAESQNRFNFVFQKFIQVFSRKEHTIVIFLDDLQWADAATLKLLPILMTDPDMKYMLIIGAYRDNEVGPAHPFMLTLNEIKEIGINVNNIVLKSLTLTNVNQLIADTLKCETEKSIPLAELILQKTDGNPFFVTQFLKSLYYKSLISFDHQTRNWIFDLKHIRVMDITDNVVALMAEKIRQLSTDTVDVLKLAACIGNQFDLNTLSIVNNKQTDQTAYELGEAAREGLILSVSDFVADELYSEFGAYKFLHDRVQQAAYTLIPDNEKKLVHLKIGRLMLRNYQSSKIENRLMDERLFDIVNHLNIGIDLIKNNEEKRELSILNLQAAQRAKSSTAHEAALNYLKAGISLLDNKAWKYDYDLIFALNFEAAECEYLCGSFDAAEEAFEHLLKHAETKLDKARVYRLSCVQYENMSRYSDAISVARQNLLMFDIFFPDSEKKKEEALDSEINSIRVLIDKRQIESLIELPIMTSPEIRMVMNILTDIWSPAYITGDALLARLISATMVRLSLIHGNVEESAYGYVTHAITVGPFMEDYKSAYEFGRLALKVNQLFNDSRRRAKINQQFHAHVNFWREPFSTCIPYAQEACRSGLESGDFLYAAYGASTESWPAILSNQDLSQFVKHFISNLELIKKLKIPGFADSLRMIMNWAEALQSETESPLSLTNQEFNEKNYIETYKNNPFFTMFHAILKLHLFYIFGDYSKALKTAETINQTVDRLKGMTWSVMFDFWNGLTLAANYKNADKKEQSTYLDELEKIEKSFSILAENCPENFLCQQLLLSAEIKRLTSRHFEAFELYHKAITYADEINMLQQKAIANELCGRYWLELKQKKIASLFLLEARSCYSQWGASAKSRSLEETYPEILTHTKRVEEIEIANSQITLTTLGIAPETLDIAAVMKASQTISGEIMLSNLVNKLMIIIMENAGAERGVLLLEREGSIVIEAEGLIDEGKIKIMDSITLEMQNLSSLPHSIVNYVKRTSESIVLADAENDSQFGNDTYIIRSSPKSILCVPVINQSKLIGIFYLENNLIPDAFTPEHIEIIQILSSQAAISLENARLFSEVEQLKNRLQIENLYLQEEIKTEYGFEEIIGQSESLKKVLIKIKQVAPSDATVLIQGETGTGKELLARAIHELSARKDRPLIKVNCGAIAAGIVESELFGHEKGAFTGALQKRIGRFELADGGTIFLDEIGELPPDVQVKLLRVLQEGEFEHVGSSMPVKVDVRIIAATNRDLVEAVKERTFREDLFYRINVFPIQAPPLRERKSDIPLLANFFINKFAKKMNKNFQIISSETARRLTNYPWPGNIRELQNVMERAVVISESGRIEIDEFTLGTGGNAAQTPAETTIENVERSHIIKILEKTNWVI